MAKKKKAKKAGKAKARRPAARTVKRARPAKTSAKRAPAKRAPAKRAVAAAPSRDPLRTLAQRIVDVTLAGDDEATYALYADNVESVEIGMPPGIGIDALREKFAMWRGMVSNATWKTGAVVVGDNAIAIEWVGKVTLANNGRTVEMREVAVHEIKNGKIARERFYYDPSVLQSAAAAPADSLSTRP